jgi:HAD superfamily hydrolase (TIGR01509 family)
VNANGLSQLVDRARCILLDFDGPICSVFAGHPAPMVAAELRRVLVDQGVTIAAPILTEDDPLEVLRYSATLGRPDIVRRIDDALRAAELIAIRSAEPTPYAREVIVAAHQTGRRVAVVSNNSADAIAAYLAARRLAGYVHPIVGRTYANPSLMKPNPAPVLTAVRELAAEPEACILVGDSTSDIDAAQAAQVPTIGYANKPGKRTRLAGADVIVESMADLATALAPAEA